MKTPMRFADSRITLPHPQSASGPPPIQGGDAGASRPAAGHGGCSHSASAPGAHVWGAHVWAAPVWAAPVRTAMRIGLSHVNGLSRLAMYERIDRRGVVPADQLYTVEPGARITMLGWLVTANRHRTKSGEFMKFLTLKDETGIYEAVLFHAAYRRCGDRRRGGGSFLIHGRVEDDGSHRTLMVDKVGKAPGAR